ncbi:hypothetical protein [Paenibacillus sp. TH7-28]
MNEMKSLKVLDRFRGLFERLGVDYPVMRRILQVKLTMDARRVPTIVGKSRKEADRAKDRFGREKEKNQFFGSLWLYFIFGALGGIIVAAGDNYLFQVSMLFGIMMFIVMTSMISDFSAVLLDIRDRSILAVRPVNRRTIAMAKALHIFFYLFFLTGAIAAVPLAVGLLKHGAGFALLLLLGLVLMDLLIVVITALLYLGVLRFFDGEKLKDIINYVQIGLTIGITVGYQLVVRLFDFTALNIVFQPRWWQYFIPPIWFGAAFETVLHPGNGRPYTVFALLSLLVPLAAFALYLKLAPALERNLQKLAEPGRRHGQRTGTALKRLAEWLCRDPQERVFFRFAWTMLGNEREFKLKVYPTLGFSIIFPFIFLFTDGFENGLQGLAGTRKYLFIYFCGLMLPTVIMMLRYSGKHKAAWIYRVLPIREEGPIYKGALLACLARLLLPLFVLESLIFVLLFGAHIIPDLVVAGLAMQLFAILCFAYLRKGLPFSEPFEATQQSEGLKLLPLMFLLGGMGLLHWAATTVPFGVIVYALLLIIAIWLGWRKVFAPGTLAKGRAEY